MPFLSFKMIEIIQENEKLAVKSKAFIARNAQSDSHG